MKDVSGGRTNRLLEELAIVHETVARLERRLSESR
jgi:hypothetical protein